MIWFRKTISLFPIFLVFIISTSTLFGQERRSFVGPYKVASYDGKASFGYRLENNDTIFHGPFKMQRSNLGALLQKKDSTFMFKGQFENNRPFGPWQFQFGEFQSDSITEIVGLQYKLNVSGIQEEATGSIVNGKPDGRWTYAINNIENSEVLSVDSLGMVSLMMNGFNTLILIRGILKVGFSITES